MLPVSVFLTRVCARRKYVLCSQHPHLVTSDSDAFDEDAVLVYIDASKLASTSYLCI